MFLPANVLPAVLSCAMVVQAQAQAQAQSGSWGGGGWSGAQVRRASTSKALQLPTLQLCW